MAACVTFDGGVASTTPANAATAVRRTVLLHGLSNTAETRLFGQAPLAGTNLRPSARCSSASAAISQPAAYATATPGCASGRVMADQSRSGLREECFCKTPPPRAGNGSKKLRPEGSLPSEDSYVAHRSILLERPTASPQRHCENGSRPLRSAADSPPGDTLFRRTLNTTIRWCPPTHG